MDKIAELFKMVIACLFFSLTFFGAIYGTIKVHKGIEEWLSDKKILIQKNEIFYKDIFNISLGVPIFLFFLIGPFILDTKWTGILILDIIAYSILVVVDGGFFIMMAVKGYMGVVWGFFLGTIAIMMLGELINIIMR